MLITHCHLYGSQMMSCLQGVLTRLYSSEIRKKKFKMYYYNIKMYCDKICFMKQKYLYRK